MTPHRIIVVWQTKRWSQNIIVSWRGPQQHQPPPQQQQQQHFQPPPTGKELWIVWCCCILGFDPADQCDWCQPPLFQSAPHPTIKPMHHNSSSLLVTSLDLRLRSQKILKGHCCHQPCHVLLSLLLLCFKIMVCHVIGLICPYFCVSTCQLTHF